MPASGPIWILLFTLQLGWQGGEGCSVAMDRTGMEFSLDSMKDHGIHPPIGSGLSKRSLKINKAGVVKRSYRRAIRRIATHGFCWYRGQCLTRADVSADSS